MKQPLPPKQYAVWCPPIYHVGHEGDARYIDDGNYYTLHETLSGAVSAHEGEEIFLFKPKRLGKFRMKTGPARVKQRKRKRK